jgi:ectonucleotide pyrophosphatase/phosphodiesterase family protein 5
MHPIFVAHGPAFKQGFKIDPFRNVDIYPLMCSILGVEPAVHNGSLDNVRGMLVSEANGLANFGIGII